MEVVAWEVVLEFVEYSGVVVLEVVVLKVVEYWKVVVLIVESLVAEESR